MSTLVQVGVGISALTCALMAGTYFAFSTFIMTALSRVAGAGGVATMQEVNLVIVRSPFIVLFFASTLMAATLAIIGLFDLGQTRGVALLAGGVIYGVGMFGVTLLFNVPLNNALAAIDPLEAVSSGVWPNYLRDWTNWNHVRTVSCVMASGLFVVAAAQSTWL